MLKRLVGHYRPEVGPADTDIDDVANALTGMALPLPAPDPSGKVSHFVEHSMDRDTTFSPSTTIDAPLRRTQSNVQDRPISVVLIFSPRNMASIRDSQARIPRPVASGV